MPRLTSMFAPLAVSATVFAGGCELPHGPITWKPGEHLERMNLFHHDRHIAPEYAADDPQGDLPCECGTPGPRHARRTHDLKARMQAHHEVPTAGPHINAPWPKYHPVPTKPVFEPRGLYEAGIVAERETPTQTR